MSIGSYIIYTVYILMSIVMFFFGVLCCLKKNKAGYALGCAAFAGTAICITYTGSMFAKEYFAASLFSSLYFASVDVMLISLAKYMTAFTDTKDSILKRVANALSSFYFIFDIVVLLINPFKEIAMSYTYEEGVMAPWRYQQMPLYQMHLIFSYLMVGYILVVLIAKMISTPRVYHGRYRSSLITILLIVILNAVFLYFENMKLIDFSILLYVVGVGILYWNAYYYSKTGAILTVKNMIINEIDQPVILFDYEDQLALKNDAALEIFGDEEVSHELRLRSFVEKYGMTKVCRHLNENYSFT